VRTLTERGDAFDLTSLAFETILIVLNQTSHGRRSALAATSKHRSTRSLPCWGGCFVSPGWQIRNWCLDGDAIRRRLRNVHQLYTEAACV
jgi:hypothetical protein